MSRETISIAWGVLRSHAAVAVTRKRKKHGSTTTLCMYGTLGDIAVARYTLNHEYEKMYHDATDAERLRADAMISKLEQADAVE